ncbi:hypothetical protein Zmor_022241 [Zophobas morio]|uniref:Uncharacterized protein n=1 Tax=Zophobas morio TaxID=2755281 RepID=A0AA38HXC1_9CUCU|nr:hypothetical protein Zmor_022241 [Zophobas morio]
MKVTCTVTAHPVLPQSDLSTPTEFHNKLSSTQMGLHRVLHPHITVRHPHITVLEEGTAAATMDTIVIVPAN